MSEQVSTGVPLRWVNDSTGYQCPYCALFVALPHGAWAACPRCPHIPPNETALLLLEHAGFDESDRENAVTALEPLLTGLMSALEAKEATR